MLRTGIGHVVLCAALLTSTSTHGQTLDAPTPLVPDGVLTATTSPSFIWTAVPSAERYLLWVNDASRGARIRMEVTALQAGCEGDFHPGRISPGVSLAAGHGRWWVQAYSGNVESPWSPPLTFTLPAADSSPSTPLAPGGTIGTTKPTFSWVANPSADGYYLWVNDSSGGGRINVIVPAGPCASVATFVCTPVPSRPTCCSRRVPRSGGVERGMATGCSSSTPIRPARGRSPSGMSPGRPPDAALARASAA